RAISLVGWQLVGKDGNEDQIVDAQDNLEQNQCEQADPGRRIEQPLHYRAPRGSVKESPANWQGMPMATSASSLMVGEAASPADWMRRDMLPAAPHTLPRLEYGGEALLKLRPRRAVSQTAWKGARPRRRLTRAEIVLGPW